MSAIKKYELKPLPQVYLEGAQVQPHTAAEIAKWAGGEVMSDGTSIVGVQIPTITGVRDAMINDFVHKNTETGRFSVMAAYDFLNGYQEVVENVVAGDGS